VLLWREFLAIFAKRPHRAIRSGSDFPMQTSHLTRRGLVLALVGALLGLGLIHDGALAADSPAPKRFTLVDRSPSELAFSWSPVKGAASYKVKMSTSSSMTKPIYAMSSDASEKISGLKAGQTYYAKVRVTDKKGDDHPHTLSSAANLARDLYELGDYEQARALEEDTLARVRRVLGGDNFNTLRAGPRPTRGHVGPHPPGAG